MGDDYHRNLGWMYGFRGHLRTRPLDVQRAILRALAEENPHKHAWLMEHYEVPEVYA